MYTHLKTYKKPILAFFGVFLMISFLLTGYVGSNHGGGDPEVGRLGKERVPLSAIRSAAGEWAFLSENLFGVDRQRGQLVPLTLAALGQDAAIQIRQHPEMYFLLLDEARRAGVTVSRDAIETRLRNEGIYVLPPGSGQPVDFTRVTDARLAEQVRASVTNLMTIRANFERAASVVKISTPLRDRAAAEQFQEISVHAVEFSAAKFAASVPAPTTQQLQNQFDRFADSDPGLSSSATNPLGFGYRYPNRVKVQYLTLPQAEVRRVVFATRPEDRWTVEAIRFYNKNQALYPTTSPASQPVADELSLGVSKPKSTGPTTRPFEEVKTQALDAVLKPEIEKLSDQILRRTRSVLQADYQAFAAAGGATTLPTGVAAPSTRPLSSLGVPFDSFEYLQKLSQSIQKEYGVLLSVTSLGDDWLDADQLRELPGIGSARDDDGAFSTLATQNVIDFLDGPQRDYPSTLRLFQPSNTLKDTIGDAYIFRVSATRKAGRPTDMKEVAAKLESDWRVAQAYDAAKAAATAAINAAKSKSLKEVADELKLTVLTTNSFRSTPYGPPIEGVTLSPLERQPFVAGAFALLQNKPEIEASAGKKPVGLIEIPSTQRIFVAELNDLALSKMFAELPESFRVAQMNRQFEQALGQSMMIGWFSFDAVKARTGYVSREESEKAKAASL